VTSSSLQAALRAGDSGHYALEAGAGLIIEHGTWLGRDDFAGFIDHGEGTAAIDWEAAINAIDAGGLPCSGGEKRMLRLAASLAADIPSGSGTPSPASTSATRIVSSRCIWRGGCC
jgi:hypothetical protein